MLGQPLATLLLAHIKRALAFCSQLIPLCNHCTQKTPTCVGRTAIWSQHMSSCVKPPAGRGLQSALTAGPDACICLMPIILPATLLLYLNAYDCKHAESSACFAVQGHLCQGSLKSATRADLHAGTYSQESNELSTAACLPWYLSEHDNPAALAFMQDSTNLGLLFCGVACSSWTCTGHFLAWILHVLAP